MAHSRAWRWPVLAALLSLAVINIPVHAASIDTGYKQAAKALDPTDAYRLALLRIKGHLGIARALLQVRAEGADYHLGAPLARIFEGIEPEIDSRNAPLTQDTLAQLERATRTTPEAALATINSAAAAVDGSFAQAGPLGASSALALAEVLLRQAVQLYAEAVSDNEVVDLRRYQTGRGLVVQAEALIRHSTGIKGQSGQDALLAAVVLIRQAWPGVRPPPIVFGPRSVAERLDEAVNALENFR